MFILMERGKDGSDYEGMFDLYVGRTLQKDIINSIPGYHDNKLVQKAISDAEKSLNVITHLHKVVGQNFPILPKDSF